MIGLPTWRRERQSHTDVVSLPEQ